MSEPAQMAYIACIRRDGDVEHLFVTTSWEAIRDWKMQNMAERFVIRTVLRTEAWVRETSKDRKKQYDCTGTNHNWSKREADGAGELGSTCKDCGKLYDNYTWRADAYAAVLKEEAENGI